MNPDEFRLWLEQNEPPYEFKTHGGRSYRIGHQANVWIPGDYEGRVCVSVPGKGIIMLRLSSIEGVQLEHDVAVSR